MNTCICMAESLHCLPETVTTLLIGYTQIQNKNLKMQALGIEHGYRPPLRKEKANIQYFH